MSDDFRISIKNAAYTLTEEQQERVSDALRAGAATGDEPKDCYWIYGADDGSDYCEECGEAEVEKLRAAKPDEEYSLDGGWRTEHDGTPYCEKCHCRLDGQLTYYGAEQEIEHFLEHGFDPACADDCLSAEEVINTIGWHLYQGEYNRYQSQFSTDRENRAAQERHWNLGKLARRILEQLDAPSCQNPPSPKSSTAPAA